jgi:hypothetical protein
MSIQARSSNVHWQSRIGALEALPRHGLPPHRITLTHC